jgi:hypothetical protein
VFVVVDVIHASLTLTSAKEPPVAAQLLPAGDRALLLAELRTELAPAAAACLALARRDRETLLDG